MSDLAMATTNPPAGDPAGPSTTTPPPNPQPLPPPNPHLPPVKAEASSTDNKDILVAAAAAAAASPAARPPERPAPYADVILIPSYSRWFSSDTISECEQRLLPEFFDGRSSSRNPRIYRYFRDSIIKLYRQNPTRKITFTDARKTLVGDVGSIRKVFDFLETWGLINYSGSASAKPLKWDDEKEASKSIGVASQSGVAERGNAPAEALGSNRESAKRICNGCKSVCTIACFASDKYDLTLCARCYVRGNYQVGVSSSDFRRVEINEETRAEWTEKETLHLLEGVMHHGDDWKKIAQHVGGRSEKECVTQFIKLPFGEEFVGLSEPEEMDRKPNQVNDNGDVEFGSETSSLLLPCKRISNESGAETVSSSLPNKRICLTPLADASNPIMAQAAFLSALAGVEVAEAAAQAVVTALSEVDYGVPHTSKEGETSSNGDAGLNASEGALMEANSLLEKEELDLEKAISEIVGGQMKRINDKIVEFEVLDLLMEKERQQVEQLKNMLFVDKFMLSFYKNTSVKSGGSKEENVKPE